MPGPNTDFKANSGYACSFPAIDSPLPGSPEFEAQRAKLISDLLKLPNDIEFVKFVACADDKLALSQVIEQVRAGTEKGNELVSTSFRTDCRLIPTDVSYFTESPLKRLREGVRQAFVRLCNSDWNS